MVFPFFCGFNHSFTVNLNFFGEVFMPRKRSMKVLYEVSSEAKKARESGSRLEIFKRIRGFKKKVRISRQENKKLLRASSPRVRRRGIFVLSGKLLNFSLKKALILLVIFAVVVVLWPTGDKVDPVEPDAGTGPETELTGNSGSGTESGSLESGIGGGDSEVVVPGPPKDHWILIASHKDIKQLEPVAKYFLENGFETEYRESGAWHTLVTKDRYLTTRDPQSQANKVKKKIIEIGDEYKPPTGFGSFTFDSVYVMKVSGD